MGGFCKNEDTETFAIFDRLLERVEVIRRWEGGGKEVLDLDPDHDSDLDLFVEMLPLVDDPLAVMISAGLVDIFLKAGGLPVVLSLLDGKDKFFDHVGVRDVVVVILPLPFLVVDIDQSFTVVGSEMEASIFVGEKFVPNNFGVDKIFGGKVDIDKLRVCTDEAGVCTDEFLVFKDEFRVCKDEFRLCEDEFLLSKDEFCVCRDEFRVSKDEFCICKDFLRPSGLISWIAFFVCIFKKDFILDDRFLREDAR